MNVEPMKEWRELTDQRRQDLASLGISEGYYAHIYAMSCMVDKRLDPIVRDIDKDIREQNFRIARIELALGLTHGLR